MSLDYKWFGWINNLCYSICSSSKLTEIDIQIGFFFATRDAFVKQLILSVPIPGLRKLTLDLSKSYLGTRVTDFNENHSFNKKVYTQLIQGLHSKCRMTLVGLFINFDGRVLFDFKKNALLE